MSPPYFPSSRLTSRVSCAETGWSLAKARLRLKRFFAALFVFCLGTCCLHLLSCGFRRPEQHDHVAPVLERRRLDLPDLLDVLGEAHEEVSPALRVALLASPEHDRDLHLRPRVEEADHVALLRLVV